MPIRHARYRWVSPFVNRCLERLLVWLLCSVAVAVASAGASEITASETALGLEPARTLEFSTEQVSWLALDLSPDGRTLVIEVLGDLYLLPATGGTAEPLTQGMAFDSQPAFSPSGSEIAFVSDRSGQDEIWLIRLNDRHLRQVTWGSKPMELASPSWSPDGRHLVVSRGGWTLKSYELWAHHRDGGKGVRLAKAKARETTRAAERHNRLGAVYDPTGRYLYYAYKKGGFGYNLRLPQWQLARHDLRTGLETPLTAEPGSAFRPQLSPDGRQLAYASRLDQETVLRLRDLVSGSDRILARGVTEDEQESRFTRDLYPGLAFSPDGQALYFSAEGRIQRLDLNTGTRETIPMTVPVALELGPLARSSRRIGLGPVKARVLQQPVLSNAGDLLVFSAFRQLYRFDTATGRLHTLTPESLNAFYPSISPDGRFVAFASWSPRGGHLYRVATRGGTPKRLTEQAADYRDLAYSPDGSQLLAIRGSAHERLLRESDAGPVVGAEVIRLPAAGGAAVALYPAEGLTGVHFGTEPDRVYLNRNTGDLTTRAKGGLVSLRLDGSDYRQELSVATPGIYYAEKDVQPAAIVQSPNGRHVLVRHAGQVYLTERLAPERPKQALTLTNAELPAVRLTSIGADYMGFSDNGQTVYWVLGNRLYRRALSSIRYPAPFAKSRAGATKASGADPATFEELEADPAVLQQTIEVYRPRAVPRGLLALEGGRVITMANPKAPGALLEDATVLVQDDRIVAVGPRSDVLVPEKATRIDVSGRWLVPGYVDTHAHFRVRRGSHGRSEPSLLANLAYGVTTGLEVQPSTTDVLAYEERIEAGLELGPRALSTGPGIFSHHQFSSYEATYQVLRRYRDFYGVRNLKAYLAGNRQQRQWLVQAASALRMVPTTEGALDMKLALTHAMDGFAGNEHNFPLQTLYDDVVSLVAGTGLGYTPTLLVLYGGPGAEEYFYSRENPGADAKLRYFTPKAHLDRRVQRRGIWTTDAEARFARVAAQAHKIFRAGGLVGVGSHGQLQGLGYHWELWALASGGFTPAEALRAATLDGARIIGVEQDIGSIEPGKLADLVILSANPLTELRNSVAIEQVLKNGVLYRASDLSEAYPMSRPGPERWW